MAAPADEALARINGYGMGAWLAAFVASLGRPLPDASLAPGALHCTARASGLVLMLGRVALSAADPRDGLVLARVEGDAGAVPPRGLDAGAETPDSAAAKLSRSTAGGSPRDVVAGDRRVSFFLDGGRIIELRFGPGLIGFDRFVLARLGAPLDWRDPASR